MDKIAIISAHVSRLYFLFANSKTVQFVGPVESFGFNAASGLFFTVDGREYAFKRIGARIILGNNVYPHVQVTSELPDDVKHAVLPFHAVAHLFESVRGVDDQGSDIITTVRSN